MSFWQSVGGMNFFKKKPKTVGRRLTSRNPLHPTNPFYPSHISDKNISSRQCLLSIFVSLFFERVQHILWLLELFKILA